MGGTWPKWFVLKGVADPFPPSSRCLDSGAGVDLFTVATCNVESMGPGVSVKGRWLLCANRTHAQTTLLVASECVSEHGKATCKAIGGQCITERDGYYLVTGLCMAFGLCFFVAIIIPTARKLQGERSPL
jgi:MFS transporter, PAT family, solute carrier family 33 (acetyl-CoA transportor), member 1